ncbi:MAG: hypothetical protein ABEL51_07355 [Salinibacter sp.]
MHSIGSVSLVCSVPDVALEDLTKSLRDLLLLFCCGILAVGSAEAQDGSHSLVMTTTLIPVSGPVDHRGQAGRRNGSRNEGDKKASSYASIEKRSERRICDFSYGFIE